jgi:hypothetical protein
MTPDELPGDPVLAALKNLLAWDVGERRAHRLRVRCHGAARETGPCGRCWRQWAIGTVDADRRWYAPGRLVRDVRDRDRPARGGRPRTVTAIVVGVLSEGSRRRR